METDRKKVTLFKEYWPSRHPLETSWDMWYCKPDRSKDWKENLHHILSVATVEEFWALHYNLAPASQLPVGSDYSFFRKGIKPMWEDEENMQGGRILINMDVSRRFTCLDNFWLEILMCLIGESFGDKNMSLINGAVIQTRKWQDKISLWIKDKDESKTIYEIGKNLKERLALDQVVCLAFEAHEDSQNRNGKRVKSMYIV